MASLLGFNKAYKLIDYIFPLYFVLAFFELYFRQFGLAANAKLFAFVILLLAGVRIYSACPNYLGIKKLFTSFIVYNLLSIIWYSINGVSFSCYINELLNSIPAMFFFFVGMCEKREDERFYRYFLYACTVCMTIGFYLYLTMPGWFISAKTELINNSWFAQYDYSENNVNETMRFCSYLADSYLADIYAIFAFGIAIAFFYNKKSFYSDKLSYLFVFINLIAAIITQHRVAIAAVVLFFLYFIVWGYRNRCYKQSSKLVTIIAFLLVLVIPFVLSQFSDRMDILIKLLTERTEDMSMSGAWGERNYQIKLLTEHWINPLFGVGIGAGGGYARSMGYPGVTDCSYIEMLYELGIVGFIFYLYILVISIRRGFRYFRNYIAELVLIGFVSVACIGSNTLTMGFVAIFPFWYCIGRIWNPYVNNQEIK